jgi:hypothetical protein
VERIRAELKEMGDRLRSDLKDFMLLLAQFKADLGQAETERQETVGLDLKERADELRASLTGFTTDIGTPKPEMVTEIPPKKKAAAKEKSVLDEVEEAWVKALVESPTE